MTAISLPLSASAPPKRPAQGWAVRTVRVVLSLGLLAAGVAVVVHADVVRSNEALASGWIAHRTTGLETFVASDRATFYWGIGSARPYGLTVTPECSSAYLVGPLAGVFGLLVLRPRLSVRRLLGGFVCGAVVIVGVNLVRLALIALAVSTWGRGPGFWWSHVVVGSVVAIAGTIAALVAALSVAFGRPSVPSVRGAGSDRGG